MSSLKLEINTDNVDDTLKLFKEVAGEIILGSDHQLTGRKSDNDFLVVDKPLKGKYFWTLE